MKIRYLTDGISKLSDDTEVVAKGCHSFYVLVPCEQGICLRAVPEEFIVSKIYVNGHDNPPYVRDFLENADLSEIKSLDYSLSEIFKVAH